LDLSEIVPPRIGRVSFSKPFIRDRDTFVSLTYQQIHKDIKFSSYLGLYNDTQDEWIYDSIQLNKPDIWGVVSGPIKIYNDKVYINQDRNILCHDLMTGELIWKRSFPKDFLFSGFIVKEGVVVANCENSVLYGLDASTGKTLWEGMGAGTSNPLNDRYLNGIVYFSGGSTNRIHAVDIHTGETVWLLEASKYDEDVDEFKPDIYVVPQEEGEEGKVIIFTPLDAYCLPAYR
jgi:outer membrane protein assembly factor BamB